MSISKSSVVAEAEVQEPIATRKAAVVEAEVLWPVVFMTQAHCLQLSLLRLAAQVMELPRLAVLQGRQELTAALAQRQAVVSLCLLMVGVAEVTEIVTRAEAVAEEARLIQE